ncbi:GNAT family N-acetyltransferase [Leuconostoc carnosum]|uniref:N-acetyltransferase domain-containing protein n=3 Tax=Leuconostoc carnosum TaxID=1252 RepID=K0DCL7_LEUCJ|nr:hypothetical protein C270_03825 [Leuconostoc carnosum JB16]KAA8329375.1 GNAT family N-acetyltransferase [Leuconostoc carnosum]QEA32803.1 GNAT family N-acetyltransferase [Leuconostoc carnosum]
MMFDNQLIATISSYKDTELTARLVSFAVSQNFQKRGLDSYLLQKLLVAQLMIFI